MKGVNIFHKGEIEVQTLVNEQDVAAKLSNLIHDSISPRMFDFIHHQFFLWIGVEGENCTMMAFPLFGSPGFIHVNQEGKELEVSLNNHSSLPDEWSTLLKEGKPIGCLMIDFVDRRRLRMNGVIKEINHNKLIINLQQVYPNCPKYIRKRELEGGASFCAFSYQSKGIRLTGHLKTIIKHADTAFVASLGPNGADLSHRGGASGFIKSINTKKIIVPDYKGNSMFNTLGNFKINPFGGLTIVDFAEGYLLQLHGKVNLLFDQEEEEDHTGGTNRFWELEIHNWNLFQLKHNLKWQNLDFSPYNPV